MRSSDTPILLLFIAGLGAAGAAAWLLARRSETPDRAFTAILSA
ncbi:MAG TPA: hypothetical protein VF552_12885 [Allosphingosinicella sp.]|jgi:hypothetical protein